MFMCWYIASATAVPCVCNWLLLFFIFFFLFFLLMIRRPPRSTLDRSSAASDVYKRQLRVSMRSANQDQQQRRHLHPHPVAGEGLAEDRLRMPGQQHLQQGSAEDRRPL